jgi:hypothetical protein
MKTEAESKEKKTGLGENRTHDHRIGAETKNKNLRRKLPKTGTQHLDPPQTERGTQAAQMAYKNQIFHWNPNEITTLKHRGHCSPSLI